jgi:hypothetical protein
MLCIEAQKYFCTAGQNWICVSAVYEFYHAPVLPLSYNLCGALAQFVKD